MEGWGMMEVITVREFVSNGIAALIALKQCRVYEVCEPPKPGSDQNRWYDLLTKRGGAMIEIVDLEQVGEDYYISQGLGMRGNHKLLMFRYTEGEGE